MAETKVQEEKPVEAQAAEQKSIIRSPSFFKIYATNTYVNITDSDFRIEVFNEKFKVENNWVFQSEGLIILTKEAAKKLLISLDGAVKAEEEKHGEIKVSEERLNFNYIIPR